MIEQNASFIQNDVSDIYVGKIESEEGYYENQNWSDT